MVCAEFTLKTRAARFLRFNLPACRGHTPAIGSAPSPLSAPSVHTPRAVSYTHLDVYKRQALYFSTKLVGFAIKGIMDCGARQDGFANFIAVKQ